MVLGINKHEPISSILLGDFNAKLSELCASDKDSKAGEDIDTFATTWDYTQSIGQSTHIINDKSVCIDLLFTATRKLLSEVGFEQIIYDKSHHNIIDGSLNLNPKTAGGGVNLISPLWFFQKYVFQRKVGVLIFCDF